MPLQRPHCLHQMHRINKCVSDEHYADFQTRLNIVFRTIFDGREIPHGHKINNDDVVLLNLVHLLIQNDKEKIDVFFKDFTSCDAMPISGAVKITDLFFCKALLITYL